METYGIQENTLTKRAIDDVRSSSDGKLKWFLIIQKDPSANRYIFSYSK